MRDTTTETLIANLRMAIGSYGVDVSRLKVVAPTDDLVDAINDIKNALIAADERIKELETAAKVTDGETKEIIAELEREITAQRWANESAAAHTVTTEELEIRLAHARAETIEDVLDWAVKTNGGELEQEEIEQLRAIASAPPEYVCVPNNAVKFLCAVILETRQDGGFDLDGGWLQDEMHKFGLLEKFTAKESCDDECNCATVGFPTDCYKFSAEAKAILIAARQVPDTARIVDSLGQRAPTHATEVATPAGAAPLKVTEPT